MTIFRNNIGTGVNLSPLDTVKEAVTASADWTLKKEDSSLGYLGVLWIEAINTTNGDSFALTFSFTRGTSVMVKVCEYIDLGQTEDNQPNIAPSSFITTYPYLIYRGAFNGLLEDVVVIDRDYIQVMWAGTINYGTVTGKAPIISGIFASSIDKAHAFTGGIIFTTTSKVGPSYREVFYEGNWYGNDVVSAVNNRQSRLNALFPPELYENGMGYVSASFYTSISIHVNLDTLEDNAELILLGYYPGNILTLSEFYRAYFGGGYRLDGVNYIGFESIALEGSNQILFPTV